MGGFLLVRKQPREATAEEIHKATMLPVLALKRRIIGRNETIYLYSKLRENVDTFLRTSEDNFIFFTGSFIYKRETGLSALRRYYDDFDESTTSALQTMGHFALVLRKYGKLHILSDYLGSYKIYHDPDYGVISTSFVAVLQNLKKATIDTQGCYEYAWNGTSFGGRTFIGEVCSLPSNCRTVLASGVETKPVPNVLLEKQDYGGRSLDDLALASVERLHETFRTLANLFGDRLSVSFSGGFDSRLALAVLLNLGVRPSLFVYGDDADRNVHVARQIAIGEGLSLSVIDKFDGAEVEVPRYVEQVERDFLLFDGWKVDGLFDNGADAIDRQRRHEGGRIPINGSLGEIFRNFYYIPDRRLLLRDLVLTFYSRYQLTACSPRFSEACYVEGIVQAMKAILETTEDAVSRDRIELLYPLFRGRFWTGRDVGLNQRFGWMFFPYLEHSVIRGTSDIPIRYKDQGRLQMRVIRYLHERLSRYSSSYGFPLSGPPSVSFKLKSSLSTWRPPLMRKFSYRIQYARKKPFPYYLHEPYVGAVMNLSFPYMENYFIIPGINDPDAYNRVCTMEYICQKYSVTG